MPAQPTLRLVTIPVSHYCEKARWALERAGLPYRELRHLQLLHYGATLFHARSLFAPVLLAPDEKVLDSTDILHWVDRHAPPELALFPSEPALAARVADWEDLFDRTIGIEARRWAYQASFEHLGPARTVEWAAQGVPSWQPAVVRALIKPGEAYLRWRLTVNAHTVGRGLAELERIFDQVAAGLADGRQFLAGDRFTAADLTFASLSALVLMPPEYGIRMLQPEELPPPMREVVERFRDHPAGRYGLRVYRDERRRVPAQARSAGAGSR